MTGRLPVYSAVAHPARGSKVGYTAVGIASAAHPRSETSRHRSRPVRSGGTQLRHYDLQAVPFVGRQWPWGAIPLSIAHCALADDRENLLDGLKKPLNEWYWARTKPIPRIARSLWRGSRSARFFPGIRCRA